ncbi:hypothetical protein NKG94_09915 [Micromonospora sp. M12]
MLLRVLCHEFRTPIDRPATGGDRWGALRAHRLRPRGVAIEVLLPVARPLR